MGEGGAAEVDVYSTDGMRYLVSCLVRCRWICYLDREYDANMIG